MNVLEELLSGLKQVCAGFPDKRKGGAVAYSMADIGLPAFSLFFTQSESFPDYQRGVDERHGASNCQTLFGMAKIPTDNHIRSMPDPVDPVHLQPCFDAAIDMLRQRGGLEAFGRLGGRTLVALDGTEYFCSQKLGCAHCLTRKRANGKTESYHAMLAATIVAPGNANVVPSMPEFIAPQDGHGKQDCERAAVKRWLASHAARMAPLRPGLSGRRSLRLLSLSKGSRWPGRCWPAAAISCWCARKARTRVFMTSWPGRRRRKRPCGNCATARWSP